MSDLKNNSVLTNQIERLQSRWTDFRLRVKQLSGTCDTNTPGILEFFVLKRVPSRYQGDEHVICLYPVWNILKQRKYRYRHLLAPGKSWQWPVCIVSPMWACDLLHLYLVGCTRVARSRRQSARQVVGKCAEQIFDPCRWEDAQFQMIYWSFQVPWIQTHSFGAAKMENRLTSYQSYESSSARLPLLHAATWLVRFYISGVTAVSCFTHCRGHGMMTGRSSPWRAMAAMFDRFLQSFFPPKKRGCSPLFSPRSLLTGCSTCTSCTTFVVPETHRLARFGKKMLCWHWGLLDLTHVSIRSGLKKFKVLKLSCIEGRHLNISDMISVSMISVGWILYLTKSVPGVLQYSFFGRRTQRPGSRHLHDKVQAQHARSHHTCSSTDVSEPFEQSFFLEKTNNGHISLRKAWDFGWFGQLGVSFRCICQAKKGVFLLEHCQEHLRHEAIFP